MRVWHDWDSCERSLFTRFHREVNHKLLSPEELSQLKATIDIDLFCQPLSAKEISKANEIMDYADAGLLSKRAST